MQWVSDNLVWLSVVLALVVVLAGIIGALVSGLRMYRRVRVAAGGIAEAGAVLNERVNVLNAALEATPARAEQLGAAVTDLRARVAVLGVLHDHVSLLVEAMRNPFQSHIR